MARKTKEDALVTREALLDAAETCFDEHGWARTTLAMIGARAGYTRGAVYWHFRNKADVVEAVIDRVKGPFMQQLDGLVDVGRTHPLRDLREVMRQSLTDLEADPRLRRTLAIIMLDCDTGEDTKDVLELRREGFTQAIERTANVIRRAGVLGQLRPGTDIESTAAIVHMIMLGAIHGYLLAPEAVDIERTATTALDIVLRAIAIDDALA